MNADTAAATDVAEDVELALLLDAIYRIYHHDFRAYAGASLRRRLRSALAHFDCPTLSRLQERVVREPALFTRLLRFLTIQVSDLFRDPAYFRAIREHVVPHLRGHASLKVWIAGCATGEEAYSLAILLLEEGLLDRTQLYATDIHPASLRVAEAGVYEPDRFRAFSERYLAAGGRASLADYYTVGYGRALFHRRLRRAILFSDHSLATDEAFGEMQLVSCRNVMIYFERSLQERALRVIDDSLAPHGFLGLGAKETLQFTSRAADFTEVAPDAHLYRRLR